MNQYVPNIILALNFRTCTTTFYRIRDEIFYVSVPYNQNYQTSIDEDQSMDDVVDYVTTNLGEDGETPCYYDIEFIDHDFMGELINAIKNADDKCRSCGQTYDRKRGKKYALKKIVKYIDDTNGGMPQD